MCDLYGISRVWGRSNYAGAGGDKSYQQALENEYEGMKIEEFSIENIENLDKEIVEECKVTFSDQVMDGGDLLYFNPMLAFATTENPFKLEERKYPVDFNFPLQHG